MAARIWTPPEAFAAYQQWLTQQPLAVLTRRAYRLHVGQYCAYLGTRSPETGDPLRDPFASTYAVRDYKIHLKTVCKMKPTSVNLSLAAVDHFARFLGLERPAVEREDLVQAAPRALEKEEQVAFLRAVERCASARDRALAHLLFYTALRIGECAALNLEDVPLSARKGKVIVRSGKGDTYREVPLNAEARASLDAYLKERRVPSDAVVEPALFLNPRGQRLSTRTIDLVLRRLGQAAQIRLSSHTLRHTCLTLLVRKGADLVLVAEIAGHRRLETTRRYSLPSEGDREAAMESVRVEY